jgi:16S rRNA processing protein RimM
MTKDNCFQLGKITKTHGVKGELILWLDVDFPDEYEEIESVLLEIKGELVPYFIEELQLRGNKSIIKFEEIDSFEAAKKLVDAEVYLPETDLPQLGENQFYYHEIINFDVIDDKLGKLGKVKGVYENNSQDLIGMDYQNVEVLIPISDEIVKSIDRTQNELYTSLPDGLLEIYLNPNA